MLINEWDICDLIWDTTNEEWQDDYVNIESDDELVWPQWTKDSIEDITENIIITLTRHMSTQIAKQEFKQKSIVVLRD